MALQESGQIKLSEIQTEFGGSAPTQLSEYYDGGSYVPGGVNANIPESGQIKLSNFYDGINWVSGNASFTSTQSWTPPTGTNSSTVFTVTLVGGGGGGGGGEGNGGGGGGGTRDERGV